MLKKLILLYIFIDNTVVLSAYRNSVRKALAPIVGVPDLRQEDTKSLTHEDILKRKFAGIPRDAFYVPMWGSKKVSCTINDQAPKNLFTVGLCGCTALAAYAKCKSGASHAIMSHYPPTHSLQQVEGLRNAWTGICGDEEIVKKELIILSPGEWVEENNKWVMKPHSHEIAHIDNLSAVAGVTPKISAYSEIKSDSQEDYFADFQFALNSKGGNWRSFGDYHMPHEIEE